jgi:hypothetical protein
MSTLLEKTAGTYAIDTEHDGSIGRRKRDLDLDDAMLQHNNAHTSEKSSSSATETPNFDRVEALSNTETPIVPPLELKELTPLMPGNFHKSTHSGAAKHKVPVVPVLDTIQKKMQCVSRNGWRDLQKAFRASDPLRSGCLDIMTFAYHLLEYDVPLTRNELNYICMTMGDPAGTMPESKATIRPRLLHFLPACAHHRRSLLSSALRVLVPDLPISLSWLMAWSIQLRHNQDHAVAVIALTGALYDILNFSAILLCGQGRVHSGAMRKKLFFRLAGSCDQLRGRPGQFEVKCVQMLG